MANLPGDLPDFSTIEAITDASNFKGGGSTDAKVVVKLIAAELEALATIVGALDSDDADSLVALLSNLSTGHNHNGTNSRQMSHQDLAGILSGDHHDQPHTLGGVDHIGGIDRASGKLDGLIYSQMLTSAVNATNTTPVGSTLAAAAEAQELWRIIWWLRVSGTTANDIDIDIDVPGSASGHFSTIAGGFNTTASATLASNEHVDNAIGTPKWYGLPGGSTHLMVVTADIDMAATPGDIELVFNKHANTDTGTATALGVGSSMLAICSG